MKFCQTLVFSSLLAILGACSDHGNHHQLYNALTMYGTPLTVEQADQLVDEITKRVSTDTGHVVQLSDNQAETVAVGFARAKIAPKRWSDAAGFAVVMVQLDRGRFAAANQTDNFLHAAITLSSAFAEPSTAPDQIAVLLNGTQVQELSASAAYDPDGARKLLENALQIFLSVQPTMSAPTSCEFVRAVC